jgi:hypothetical protein
MRWFKRKEEVDVGAIVSACNNFREKLNPVFKYWQFDDTMVSFQLGVYVCALFSISNQGSDALFQRICDGMMGRQTIGKLGNLLPSRSDISRVSNKLPLETSDTNWAKDFDGIQLIEEIHRRTRAVEMPISDLLYIMVEIRQKTLKGKRCPAFCAPELAPICEGLEDTVSLAYTDVYVADLAFHQNVKQAAERGVPGTDTIYDDLKQRFPGRPRVPPPTPPTP